MSDFRRGALPGSEKEIIQMNPTNRSRTRLQNNAGTLSDQVAALEQENQKLRSELEAVGRTGEKSADSESSPEGVPMVAGCRAILNNLPGYLVLKDSSYRILYANRHFVETFPGPASMPSYRLQYGSDDPSDDLAVSEVLPSGRQREWEHRTSDGRIFRVWGIPMPLDNGEPAVLEIGIDLTGYRQVEMKVTTTDDRKRRAVSCDLHNKLAQELTGIAYMVHAMSARATIDGESGKQALGDVAELVEQCTARIRSLAKGLDPIGHQLDGLHGGLHDLVGQMERRHGISCRIRFDERVELPSFTALQLYRIAEDALRDAAHAGAAQTTIQVRRLKTGVLLEIFDDGEGSDPEYHKSYRPGTGFSSMEYRAGAISSRLRFRRTDDGRQVVSCFVAEHTGWLDTESTDE
ncbi:MAG: histidine kinase [Phycisphaerae bacterium]